MAIEKDFFRQVMGQFATGIAVVTTQSKAGIAGITVNSFCSVSLDPPLVLACIELRSHVLPYIRESNAFAVNILTHQQEYLSRCFATAIEERFNHFCHTNYHLAVTGSPIIDEVLAFVDARVVAEYPGGDHAIFLGQVEAIGTMGYTAFANDSERQHMTVHDNKGIIMTNKTMPLAYYRGEYRHLARNYHRPSLTTSHNEKSK